MKIYDILEERGYIHSISHDEIKDKLNNEKVTFYIGIDMTADSMTAGHFQTLMTLRWLQQAGHRPIILIGGGTTLIPDPTGKDEMRKIMDKETIAKNAEGIKKQMEKFITFGGDNGAIMVNNADWLTKLNYIDFLREYGPYFSVNRMIHMETYQTRLDKGLTLLEFNYLPMQAYDFLHLHREYGAVLQIGGSDQWSNILAGADLIRRVEGGEGFAMVFNLLTTSSGEKMGKSVAGAVWLDPERTSPYEFFQYWRNVEDASVEMLLKRLTMMDMEEIKALTAEGGSALNKAKEVLAFELTKTVHGEEEAQKSLDAARSLFGGNMDTDNMPETTLSDAVGKEWSEVLVEAGLCDSKAEAKRLIKQGGFTVGDTKVTAFDAKVEEEQFEDGQVIIKKGKKQYHKIIMA